MFFKTPRIIIVRHGESEINVQGACGGWINSPLTELGISQARQIAQVLKQHKLRFDICISSVLSRAVETRNIILKELNLVKSQNPDSQEYEFKIPVFSTWKLNESHSGALTGLTIEEVADKFGNDAIQNRYRIFDHEPPPVPADSKYNPGNDPFYSNAEDRELLPLGESLASAWKRAEPYWKEVIEKKYLQQQKKSILVVTHGNIIRAIMKYCENLSPEEGMRRKVLPNCSALVYDYKNKQYINRKIFLEPEAMKKFKLIIKEKQSNQKPETAD